MCHTVEDGTFKEQFTELVRTVARLEPFPEDGLEAEEGRFGQTPAVIAAVAFPRCSPPVADLAQILIAQGGGTLCGCHAARCEHPCGAGSRPGPESVRWRHNTYACHSCPLH